MSKRNLLVLVPVLVFAVLTIGLVAPLAAQVDVSNFSNLRTDGFTRADTYLRSGTYAQVGTFLRLDPAAVITHTSGALTPLGTFQPLVISGTHAITNVTVQAAGTLVVFENTSTTVITFTDSTPLVLSGACALGQYDILTVLSDGTRWIEQSCINN